MKNKHLLLSEHKDFHLCPNCNKCFKSKEGLNKHISKVHDHQCKTCDQIFKSEEGLNKHMLEVSEMTVLEFRIEADEIQ